MARWTVQELQRTDWFHPLLDQIQRALEVLSAERHAALPVLAGERDQLRQQIQGWSQSLAKPDLSLAVRGTIEKDMEAAVGRMQQIEQQMAEADALRRQAEAIVDPEQAVERLNRLADVLTAQNPSRTNLELSLHIEAIRCHDDGRVVVKICKLGALAGGKELLARPPAGSPQRMPSDPEAMPARPRRRAVRRVAADDGSQAELQAMAHEAADVHRFAGLGSEWFWEDILQLPGKTYWSEVHAKEVAAKKQETGWSTGKLAEYFKKTTPTIRKALQIAKEKEEQGNNGNQPPG